MTNGRAAQGCCDNCVPPQGGAAMRRGGGPIELVPVRTDGELRRFIVLPDPYSTSLALADTNI